MNAAKNNKMNHGNIGRMMISGRKAVALLAAGSLWQAAGCDLGRGIGNLFGSVIVGVMEVVEIGDANDAFLDDTGA